MDLTTSRRLIEELAPVVTGATVAAVSAPGPDCVLLELAGKPRRWFGAVTLKALPILFLLEDDAGLPVVSSARGESPFGGQLKGAEITGLDPLPDRPGAVVRLRWTSQVGRAVDRKLKVALGRNPSLSLAEARRGAGSQEVRGTGDARLSSESSGGTAESSDGSAAPEPPDSSPTVTSWRDEQGRLHARLSAIPRSESAGTVRGFESLNDGAVFMFTEFWPELSLSARRDALRRVIERRIKRTNRAMEKVKAEIEDSENAERYRRLGQLLLTRQDLIRRGASSVTLRDYDGETDVVVELDPSIGPQQNAQSYFRRARKAERRLARAPLRLGELEKRAEGYRSASDSLDGATPEVLARLEVRLLKEEPANVDRKAPGERARFRTYRISGGWEVLVGKSNKDNDVLSHQIAKPDDLWFHARQVAGSHVVLRRAGSKAEPDRTAILEAAAIAAYHSKAGKSSKVSVCYTEKRHVRKARGGRPGEAVIAREKVVLVEPRLPES